MAGAHPVRSTLPGEETMSAAATVTRLSQHSPASESPLNSDAQQLLSGLLSEYKSIPCAFYYDELGSHYYEQLCEQPEYYLARTERRILHTCSDAMAAETGPCDIVELGSGNGRKTAVLMAAYQMAGRLPAYYPIDICQDSIERSIVHLSETHAGLTVTGLVGTYAQGLQSLPKTLQRRLFLFLGSSLGNMTDSEIRALLREIRSAGRPGDMLLVGADLDKDPALLAGAYNDAAGWASRMNLNLLHNVNRRYGANFDVSRFAHLAFHNPARMQVEAHLRSLCRQQVHIATLAITIQIARGDTLQTQIARKFEHGNFQHLGSDSGFAWQRSWTDPQGWSCMALFRITE